MFGHDLKREDGMATLGTHTAAFVAASWISMFTATVAEAETIRVYSWPDYIPDSVLQAFTQETGIDVEITPYESVDIAETKLLTGTSGFDVVVTAVFTVPRLIGAGVLHELDHGSLPNLKNLDAGFMVDKLSKIDAGSRFSVPMNWGLTTVAVNVDKVRAILGPDAPLDSYSLIFDPAIAEKLQACGITFLDSGADAMGLAMLHNGVTDLFHPTTEQLQQAAETIRAVVPYVRYFDNVRYWQDLAGGDTCVAMAWNNDIYRAIGLAKEAGQPQTLKVLLPKEGALIWSDHLVVPKDAPNPGAAEKFLDFVLRGESAAAITNTLLVATPNTQGRDAIDPALREAEGIFPPAEWVKRLSPDDTFDLPTQRDMMRFYTQAKTGN
jgi:putrescine transport system substrate-binding protein